MQRASRVGGWLGVKNRPTNVGDVIDVGSMPGLRRSPGGRNGNLLQYSCLENPMNTIAWQAMGSQTVGHDYARTHAHKMFPFFKKWDHLTHGSVTCSLSLSIT